MIVLGIDPGTAICGFGIVKLVGSRMEAIDFGVIETHKSQSQEERLKVVFENVCLLIDKHRPDKMGVEQLFFNKNVTTAISVGQARGVILLAAAMKNIAVYEYTPLQVKQSVTGYGRATKAQMIFMTQKLLNLKEAPKPDDAADALAIGVCTAHVSSVSQVWQCSKQAKL